MDSVLLHMRLSAKTWAVVMSLTFVITLGALLVERYGDPHDDYSDAGATGPYAVRAVAIADSGDPVYELAGRVDQVAPGAVVGWVSTMCVEQGRYLLSRPDLVRLRDGATVQRGRERLWTPEDHRCGSVVAALQLPVDAEAGNYEVRRFVWARPLGWLPLRATLQAVRFRVGPPAPLALGPPAPLALASPAPVGIKPGATNEVRAGTKPPR